MMEEKGVKQGKNLKAVASRYWSVQLQLRHKEPSDDPTKRMFFML